MQSEKNENHDGRVQRRNVIKRLAAVSKFSVSNFKVRHERCLGSGSFGQVYAGSFGFKQKIQCVVKIAKKGAEEDLILEGRILRKIFDEPVDSNQMFFLFLYGYHNDEKGLVMERFFGYSVKQHALGSIQNDWIKRITEISKALMFLHSREILHLDIHASNVLASPDTTKLIDFGKATLEDFAVTYNLDAVERELYNRRYQQIEFELRNEKLCKTKRCSDVYSLGALILYIVEKCPISVDIKCRLEVIGKNCCAPRAIRNSLDLIIIELNELSP